MVSHVEAEHIGRRLESGVTNQAGREGTADKRARQNIAKAIFEGEHVDPGIERATSASFAAHSRDSPTQATHK